MTEFRTLAQLSSDALLVVNDAGRITYANPAALALLAPPGAPLEGRQASQLWQPDPLANPQAWDGEGQLSPTLAQVCDGPAAGTVVEMSGVRTDSPAAPGHCICLKARPAGAVPGGLAERVRTAMALSTDAVMVVDAQTLAFVDANAAACALMGMTREQVLARGPATMRRRDGSGNEDFRALYAQLIERAPQALTHEYDFIAGDGRAIPVAATRQALNLDGRWLIFITWRDISERVAVRARLEQFKAAFDQTADAVTMVDVTTRRYIYSNPAHLKLLGLTQEELDALGPEGVARRFGGLQDQQDLQGFYDSLIAQYPQPLLQETTHLAQDGSPRYTRVRHHALRSGSGWLVVSAKIDITARKLEQRRLERITAAFDASGDAIYIIDPATFSYVDVNEAAARLHGMSRDELRALGVRGAFPGRLDDAGLRARYDDLIAHHPQAITEEREVTRADGRPVWAESIRRAIQVDGQWLVISVMRDITERKAAQARQDLLLAAIDAAPDAVAILDPQTFQYVHVNDAVCRLHGLTREEAMARGMLGMFAQFTPEALRQRYDSLIATSPRAVSEERTVRRADGSEVVTEAVRRAVRIGDRWLVISVSRDITERKAQQARMELMRQAMDAAPDAIVAIDPETLKYIAINNAATQMTGMSREEMFAKGPLASFGSAFDSQELRATYTRVIDQAPRTVVQERSVPRADRAGQETVLEFTRRAVQIDGRWVIVSVNRDITERKAAQAHVEMLRAAIDLAPDAFFLIDPQALQYIDVNRAAGAMYGLSREQVLSMGLLGYVRHVGLYGHEQAQARLREDYDAVIAQYPQPQVTERAVRLPGREVVYNENVRKAVRLDGRWLIVSVTRNITERRRQQARMQRFAAIVNMSADAVILVDRDSMRIIDVNEAACRMHGYSRDEMLALPPHLSRQGTTLEQLAADYDEAIRRAPDIIQTELHGLRADGSTFIAEVQRQAHRQADGDGGWIIAITVRDITERKASEAGLQRLKAVVDVAPDGMYIVDPSTQEYVALNHAAGQLYGLTRDEVLRMGMNGFMRWLGSFDPSLQPESVRERHLRLIDQYPQVHVSERLVRLPGRADIVTETLRQAVRVDGQWLILVVVRDITQRKRAEDEIRARMAELTRSNQELEQFAYVTSHDLSEPLRMVASYTQLLSKRYADKFDDDGREFIKYAVDGAQRMKQLIDDLLMYSRAGRSRAPMRLMRLDRALDDALANLAHAVERNNATIERGPMPELVCEKAGLTQVFQNLVANAIKFRGEAAPVVRITASQDEHFWTISVADNGIGIANEYFQRIFIIFQRLHSRSKYEGTGIGLSICKKIVERHGGQITVASEPGQGTTFSFTLSKSLPESEPS